MSQNIPNLLTRFVGREKEISGIINALRQVRLLTLTGPGGCGKTRLAIEVVSHLENHFPKGIFWLDLAPITDETFIAQSLAAVLNLRDQQSSSIENAIISALSSRETLIVFDNCEHIISGCASLIDFLLKHCPSLKTLATSREGLTVAGEHIWPVPTLSTPSARMVIQNEGDLTQIIKQYEAIQLFDDRARAVKPDFRITKDNFPLIARICQQLDGLPLAIELASACTNVLSVQQIATRLEDRFALLISAKRVSEDIRHQTLRTTIDWSYDHLTPREQALLNYLSVFESGCTLDAAEAVCIGNYLKKENILATLTSLVEKSLLAAETINQPEARYWMLETIRQYAHEKLAASGDLDKARSQHLDFFIDRSTDIAGKLRGKYQQLWLSWLDVEIDNLRKALSWALKSSQIEGGVKLSWNLLEFWYLRRYWQEGHNWSEKFAAQCTPQTKDIFVAKAYVLIGRFAWLLGNYTEAKTAVEKAYEFAEHAGEDGKDVIAILSIGQASGIRARGEFEKAFNLYQQAVDLFRERGHYYLADALLLQAVTATSLKRFDIANSLLTESLNMSQNQGDDYWIAYVFASKGDLSVCQQDFSIAQQYYNRSLEIYREYNAKVDIARIHNKLAITHLFQGNLSKAHDLLVESIEIQRSINNPRNLAEGLFGFGVLAAVTKQPIVAIRLFSFIIQLVGNEFFYAFPAEEVIFQQLMDELRKGTLPEDFNLAQKSGEVLSMETAIELALSLSSGEESLLGSKGLTPRQEEIVGLIAEGKTNGEIAAQLVISKRTVEKHIANIFMRLNFSHRAEIVRWAIENGLVNNTSHS